ncbi:MAG: metallophosphoesterase, partial [Planctomycetaceae bacterium]|nr:metallophosphoesterase [Planctomycetaceae bacterium]
MRIVARLIPVCLLFSAVCVSTAHEGHEHGKSSDKPAAARYPNGILLPAMDGAKPWSDKPVLDDPDRFQIAIMTDNTGGHRPGIWMKAVERLNLLRPAFVMSVGDLIEGYSEDPAELEAEWAEFLGFIDQMQMRFFFVAGNHDVSNPTAHALWRKKFGAEWY